MSDCTGGESNAVVRKRNGKRRFRRVRGVKSANIRRIQKPNLHFGLRGIICAAAALFIAFAILFDSAFSVPLRALAEEKAARLAAELLNSAVLEVMEPIRRNMILPNLQKCSETRAVRTFFLLTP